VVLFVSVVAIRLSYMTRSSEARYVCVVRSDRTRICTACRARFSAAQSEACPICEREQTVHDGRGAQERDRAMQVLAHRRGGGRGWIGLDGAPSGTGSRKRGLIALAAVMGGAILVVILGAQLGFSPIVPLVLLGAGVFGWVVLRPMVVARQSGPTLELAIHTPTPGKRSDEARRLRGRVRILEGVPAPVSGEPCAAFRVVGHAHGGQIDDAGGGVIEIVPESDDGPPVRIDLSAATISIDVANPPRVVQASPGLGRFLEERWLFPDAGPIRIAEATLVDGDSIELDAVILEETTPQGYRQTKVAHVAEDQAATRAIVRRVKAV